MNNRRIMNKLLFVVLLLALAAGSALAQDTEPAEATATNVRVAHLAPFEDSHIDTRVQISINGTPLPGGEVTYGDARTNLPNLPGPGDYLVEISLKGSPVLSKTITLGDGNYSVVAIGDNNLVPFDLMVLADNGPTPGTGRTVLRIAHISPIGSTIDTTRVDVCSQAGIPFHTPSGVGLRYKQATSFRDIQAGLHDLKVTRFVDGAPCTGQIIIDPPPMVFAEGKITTLFLVGDGTNQPFGVFTFENGLVDGTPGPQPGNNRIYIPNILR